MKILVAPNAFKNSVTATEAAQAICSGFEQSMLACSCEPFPIGDGGDGTAILIINKCGGVQQSVTVADPLWTPVTASYGLIDNGQTAIIEMADASGLRLLPSDALHPLLASSFGTGELIKAALDKGATKIIIGMGGSATVDGGTGILAALGARFLDADNCELERLPGELYRLKSLDLSALDSRIDTTEFIVLCDVDNQLLGEQGAAAVFGPQKGASPTDVTLLEEGLSTFAAVACQTTGRDMATVRYGGTAGGAAAGLYACINAQLVNGINYFLQLTGFDHSLENAQLLVTGEGSLDEQTLQGKGPCGVAGKAREKNIPVIALAGKVPLTENNALAKYFDVLLPIGHQPTDLVQAFSNTSHDLTRTATAIGNLLSLINK